MRPIATKYAQIKRLERQAAFEAWIGIPGGEDALKASILQLRREIDHLYKTKNDIPDNVIYLEDYQNNVVDDVTKVA